MWLNISYKNENRQLVNLDKTLSIQVTHSDSEAALHIGYSAVLTGSTDYIEKLYGIIFSDLQNSKAVCTVYEEGVTQ